MSQGGPTDPSHDADLRRGILRTDMPRWLAWVAVVVFVLMIYGLPVGQAVIERVNGEDSMLLDIFKRAPTKESFKQYEDDIDKASYIKERVQPRVQYALTNWGGAGNKKALIGRGGWLFYKPGVMAVAGPGFLDEAWNRSRAKSALDEESEVIHPDPRPAILDFHRALAARGIKLVLFPVPDKSSAQPLQLHGRAATAGAASARNRDYDRFVAEMRAAGIVVLDLPLPGGSHDGRPRYLVQDTHWTPEFMTEAAAALVQVLVPQFLPARPPRPAPPPRQVSRLGDIVDMLKLPEGQTGFVPQTVTLYQMQDWQPKPDAPVLLLGDSFTNIFSLEQMGWGESAGLAPTLSRLLDLDIDVIAQNDSGAFATRQTLSRALGAGEDRLKGKRVVIWEFASRELAVGDWKPLPWPAVVAEAAR